MNLDPSEIARRLLLETETMKGLRGEALLAMRRALGSLQAAYIVHQISHWGAKGPNFYAQHQLFERAYKSASEGTDSTAERGVGLSGTSFVDFEQTISILSDSLRAVAGEASPLDRSILVERRAGIALSEARGAMKKDGVLTVGTDDMLMSLASDREQTLYLLRQSRGG